MSQFFRNELRFPYRKNGKICVIDDSLRHSLIENSSGFCAICRDSLLEICVGCAAEEVVPFFNFTVFENYLKLQKEQEITATLSLRHAGVHKDIIPTILQAAREGSIFTDFFVKCPIVIGRKPCGHVFHSHCIDRWTRKRDVCPLCNTGWFPHLSNSEGNFKII